MKITIVCVGKLKERYWQEAVAEYTKRLSKYVQLDIVAFADEKAPETLSPAQEEQVKEKEAQRMLKAIPEQAYLVTMEIGGKALSSEEFSSFLQERALRGDSHVVFAIGGSLGLGESVLKRANYRLSFSKLTSPHQMMRVILLEQIYRAIKIERHEPYHK